MSTSEVVTLSRKDNWRNVAYLGADWASIIGSIAVARYLGGWPIVALAVVWIGSRQRALANLLHEGSHQKLFSNLAANDFVSRFFIGYPILISFSSYTKLHRVHHRRLWAPDDADAEDYRSLGWGSPSGSRLRCAAKLLLDPLTRFGARSFGSFVGVSEEDRFDRVARPVFLVATICVLAAAGEIMLFVQFWALPFCTSYLAIWYFSFVGEHGALEGDDPYLTSRSWTAGPLWRWVLAPHSDDLFHLAHHLYPRIPHYRLKETHSLLWARDPQYRRAPYCEGVCLDRPGRVSVLTSLAMGSSVHREPKLDTPNPEATRNFDAPANRS